jgi:hypothetical protein
MWLGYADILVNGVARSTPTEAQYPMLSIGSSKNSPTGHVAWPRVAATSRDPP